MATTVTCSDTIQQVTETEVPTAPFLSEPEIYGENIFNLGADVDTCVIAENLAVEAKSLLNILTTVPSWNIREKFQIELRKMNIDDDKCFSYKMSLRIDPTVWFKYCSQNVNDIESFEQLYENGCSYYEKVKYETENETKSYFDIKNEDDIERLEFNPPSSAWCRGEKNEGICNFKSTGTRSCYYQHYKWCSQEIFSDTGKCEKSCICNIDPNCYHFSSLQKDPKVIYQCKYEYITLKGRRARCLFKAYPNFRIYADNVKKPTYYPYFIVSSRPNATPIITLNPIKHCTSEEYVATSDAWQAVLQTLMHIKDTLKLDKLPLNRIHINFGKWMSQKEKDPSCRYCHAHINIVLTRETIETINDRNKSDNEPSLFPSLVGSILPPDSYRLHDAQELMKYIAGQRMPLLIKNNRELKKEIDALKYNFEKLEREYENQKQLIPDKIQYGDEIEESTKVIDQSDFGKGINHAIVMQESKQDFYPKWNRFLFPWNQF